MTVALAALVALTGCGGTEDTDGATGKNGKDSEGANGVVDGGPGAGAGAADEWENPNADISDRARRLLTYAGDGESDVENRTRYLKDTYWIPELVTVTGEVFEMPAEVETDGGDPRVRLLPGDYGETRRDRNTRNSTGCRSFTLDSMLHRDLRNQQRLWVAAYPLTEKGCGHVIDAWESAFLEAFNGKLAYEIDDADGPGENQPATLTLWNAYHEIMIFTEDFGAPGRDG